VNDPVGLKYDLGKLRWDLVPWDSVEEIVKVITMGAEKYAENNWKFLDRWDDRYFAAALRHLMAYRSGNPTDEESGLPHLAHAITNLLFMLHLFKGQS
jgi:hypothetical protein